MSRPTRVYTTRELAAIDAAAMGEFGMPEVLLVERAAWGAFEEAGAMLAGSGSPSALVVAGPGNNGADGLALARLLDDAGVAVRVVCLEPRGEGGLARSAHRRMAEARGLGLETVPAGMSDEAAAALIGGACAACGASLVVDALLGTGLTRAVEGAALGLIEGMNGSGAAVLSLDVPSGLDAEDGSARPVAVRATRTVTFVGLKRGFESLGAQRWLGEVVVRGVGVPEALCERYGRVPSATIPPTWRGEVSWARRDASPRTPGRRAHDEAGGVG